MNKRLFLGFILICTSVFGQKKWTLNECIEYAKKNNLQVISSKYNQKIQENNLNISKNEFLPSVSGNINNTGNFGQTQGFQGGIGRNDNFNNNIRVSADMLLYSGGRLRKQVEKNMFAVKASEYDLETIQNNVSLQIIQQYLSVLLNKEVVKVRENALEYAEKLYEKAKITTDIGTTPKTILIEAESTLAREKQNLKTAEINVKRSLFDLALLLQLKEYKNFDVEDILLDENLSDLSLLDENKILEITEIQPQIKAAESRIGEAKKQVEINKSFYYPTISASVGIGSFYFNSLVTNNVGIDAQGNIIKEKGVLDQYENNFSQQANLSINIPIFNKGNTKLQVEQALINEDIALNNLSIQKQEVMQNIQKAQFNLESNYEVYIYAQEAEKSAESALSFAEKSYQAGKTSIYDFNIANNNYVNAKGTSIQAKYNYIFSKRVLEFYMNH